MNTDVICGNWLTTKAKLKKQFANPADDGLRYVEGEEEELIGRLQRHTDRTHDEIERLLEQQPSGEDRRKPRDLRIAPGAENFPGAGGSANP